MNPFPVTHNGFQNIHSRVYQGVYSVNLNLLTLIDVI